MEFKDKFVAFIDVLGFKKHVEATENGSGMSLAELLELLSTLGSHQDKERFQKHGPTICPHSSFKQKDLDFKITQISDCAIISSEVSPAGIVNLMQHCSAAAWQLLFKGVLCRGYVTRGNIYHTDNQVIGSGYQTAYERERTVTAFSIDSEDHGTPFVQIDPVVCDYVITNGDECVKKMFSRMTKSEDGVTGLFPFQRISHNFMVAGFGVKFDPDKELAANNIVRSRIVTLKERIMQFVDASDQRVMKKVQYYMRALDEQLIVCDRTENAIRQLTSTR